MNELEHSSHSTLLHKASIGPSIFSEWPTMLAPWPLDGPLNLPDAHTSPSRHPCPEPAAATVAALT